MTQWSFEARIDGSLPVYGEVNADTRDEARQAATDAVISDAPRHNRPTEAAVQITSLSRT